MRVCGEGVSKRMSKTYIVGLCKGVSEAIYWSHLNANLCTEYVYFIQPKYIVCVLVGGR